MNERAVTPAQARNAVTRWSAHAYARHGRFVADLAVDLVTWLAPRKGERILDLGCGDGALTARLAASRASVQGVDSSPELVAAACARGVDAKVLDGAQLAYESEFDAVFSNASLHWMRDTDAVLRGVHRALKPGGRFVAELGCAGNIATVVNALTFCLAERGIRADDYNPWYFPEPQAYRELLGKHGFMVTAMRSFVRPTCLSGDLRGWLETFAQPFTKALPTEQHEAFMEDVTRLLHPTLFAPQGRWVLDYVRLRFSAHKL